MTHIKTTAGDLAARDLRMVIVASRFNESVVARLIEGAVRTLLRHGVAESAIELVRVPGAFEIPAAVARAAAARQPDAIIALGAVIRGETPHFEYICAACGDGLGRLALELRMPIAFGVLTVDHVEQALERSGAGDDNKGSEAAASAIEMARLFRLL
jgi:6,7-dimethyl-8-ribityllumazine synthase